MKIVYKKTIIEELDELIKTIKCPCAVDYIEITYQEFHDLQNELDCHFTRYMGYELKVKNNLEKKDGI